MDGARVFNAALALSIPASTLAQSVDSLMFCFSKGLSAPVGSMLVGSKEFIRRAHRIRKLLGGGMRQAGILAAAAIVALEQMVERLAEDHAHCQLLAHGLAELAQIDIEPERVVTNILIFTLHNAQQRRLTETETLHFLANAREHGVLLSHMGDSTIRAVTHYGLEEHHITAALTGIRQALREMHYDENGLSNANKEYKRRLIFMKDLSNGELFSNELMKEIRDSFYYIDNDPDIGNRLFFDNAGGSFRLKKAVEQYSKMDAIPDCPERIHERALYLQKVQDNGIEDIKTLFNAKGGSVFTSLTASEAMFNMVRAIAENVGGTNMITTVLEHPSAYDPMVYYSDRLGKELRIAKNNPVTGGVDADEIIKLIDKDTCLLSVIYASNISGAIFEIENIVKRAREIKPDLYIIVDAVSHAPHGVIDLQKTPIDGINFAPYKFFGCRGSGIAWLSDRAAVLPHHKLIAKDPDIWELGSPAPAQFAVITEIVNYVCWIGSKFIESNNRRELFVCGMTKIALQERALMSRMLNGTDEYKGLRNMKGVKVFWDYVDLTKRDFILAMGFENIEYTQAVREYEKRGVIVYERVATSLYSKRMLESFGMDGAIRVSPLHCNSTEDIDRFLKITMEISQLEVTLR